MTWRQTRQRDLQATSRSLRLRQWSCRDMNRTMLRCRWCYHWWNNDLRISTGSCVQLVLKSDRDRPFSMFWQYFDNTIILCPVNIHEWTSLLLLKHVRVSAQMDNIWPKYLRTEILQKVQIFNIFPLFTETEIDNLSSNFYRLHL